jgi:hypothetical protein
MEFVTDRHLSKGLQPELSAALLCLLLHRSGHCDGQSFDSTDDSLYTGFSLADGEKRLLEDGAAYEIESQTGSCGHSNCNSCTCCVGIGTAEHLKVPERRLNGFGAAILYGRALPENFHI